MTIEWIETMNRVIYPESIMLRRISMKRMEIAQIDFQIRLYAREMATGLE